MGVVYHVILADNSKSSYSMVKNGFHWLHEMIVFIQQIKLDLQIKYIVS